MLEQVVREIDPVQLPLSFFDPTEPSLIGRFISIALVAQPRQRLEDLKGFYGAGVYALYYVGDFTPYAPVSRTETPIYVGKADPEGNPKSPVDQGTKLFDRLKEHRKSIRKVEGIDSNHFECRYLAVQSGYQAAAERHLISLFKPLWNNETKILFGIGKHGDSAETRTNNKSPWDTLHPGREWAKGNPEAVSRDAIVARVERHFTTATVFATVDSVLEAFLNDLRRTNDLVPPSELDSSGIVAESS
ncbi:Eco29kI family restriction endonuclease [Pannonibacter phragmitetus]|nr:Eco29kI family restriction endonuclease [Pannonibacter phragmitetus]